MARGHWIVGLLTLVPSIARAWTPYPQGKEPVRIDVVDAATGLPVDPAQTSWVPKRDWLNSKKGDPHPRWFLEDWLALHESVGRKGVTEDGGHMWIPAGHIGVHVIASSGEFFGTRWVDEGAEGPLRLELRPDRSADVLVVDEAGAPVAGALVGLCPAQPELRMSYPWLGYTDAAGKARVLHTQEYGEPGEAGELVLTIASPLAGAPEVEVDLSSPPQDPVRLVHPPTGRVVVEGLRGGFSYARLRTTEDAEAFPLWFKALPWRVAMREGRVVFPHVGLGLELQLETYESNTGAKNETTIRGPTEAGETVVTRAPGALETLELCGRLFDWTGAPIVSRKMRGMHKTGKRGSNTTFGLSFTTDADGHFDLRVAPSDAPIHTLEIRPSTSRFAAHSSLKAQRVLLDLASLEGDGPHDLGDLRLEMPLLGRLELEPPLTDRELLEALDVLLAEDTPNRTEGLGLERCLVEMANRRSPEFEAPLRTAYEAAKAADRHPPPKRSLHKRRALALLTALRRVQGVTEPISFRVNGPSELELPFPEFPDLYVSVVNTDAGGETVYVESGGDYRSGRFTRCRVIAIPENGSPLPTVLERGGILGGVSTFRPHEAGDSWNFVIPMASFVRLQSRAWHDVSVEYHDWSSIAHLADTNHLLVVRSEPFRFRWTPRTVQLSESHEQRIHDWIEAIDEASPVLLAEFPYHPKTKADLGFGTPARAILGEGWDALPPLLRALEDPSASAGKRAWILALLYDLTGIHNPLDRLDTLGEFKTIRGWRRRNSWPVDTTAYMRSNGGGPHRAAQEPLVTSWKELSALVRVERPR